MTSPSPENSVHEYEPGEVTMPMESDPLCLVCGISKKSVIHNLEAAKVVEAAVRFDATDNVIVTETTLRAKTE